MSQSVGVLDISDKKAEGAGIKQYYLVKEGTAADQVVVSGSAAERALGPVQTSGATIATDIAAGVAVSVRVVGTSKFVAAGAITRGDRCTSNGDGRIKVTTTDKEWVCCHALETAGGAGDVIEGLLTAYTLSI